MPLSRSHKLRGRSSISPIDLSRLVAAIAAGLLSLAAAAVGETAGGFREITREAGLTHVQHESYGQTTAELITGGGAVGDFFGTGRKDLFVTRYNNTDIFYKNMGDGTFEDRTKEVFGENPVNAPTNGALMADFNNDGHLDLYVTTVGTGRQRHFLYINDGNGRLIEETRDREAGIERREAVAGMSVTAGDFTGNGYLDLYVSDWSNRDSANRLLRNRGSEAPGFFEDVTESAGLAGPANRWGFGARFADMNRNGLLDLVPYNDFDYNQFFWNRGNGTFREVGKEVGTTTGVHEMGISVADFNNNGWMDIFLTDIGRNVLYENEMHRNVTGLFFTERAFEAGVGDGNWGWGTATIDYDNDGWRDLVSVNGWMAREPIHFWRNNGGEELSFTRISEEAGLTDINVGRGVIVADFTGDGWQDILVLNHAGAPALYENLGGTNDWLRIDLAGRVSNTQGIGAWITVTPDMENGDTRYVHEVNLEANFLSHSETTAHFGLGKMNRNVVDHVHIRWPSGLEQDLYDLEVNRVHTIVENSGSPELDRFEAAAAAAGLAGADAEPDAVPFGDGIANFLKYAFNMDLSRADSRALTPAGSEKSGLPCVYVRNDGQELVIEFLRRGNSDLIYTPKWSSDLRVWHPAATAYTATEIDSEWERAIIAIPLDPSVTQAFAKVEVTLP